VYPIRAVVENLKFILTIRGKQHRAIRAWLRHNACSRFPNHRDIGGMRLTAENFLEILNDAVQVTQLFFGVLAPML